MTYRPCLKEDRAQALAADARRQTDAAWRRLRLIYFCGICWTKIREIQREAQRLIDTGVIPR